MVRNVRSQAALEFLTTYGWAFIVILVMVSALSYFGVLSPSSFVGDRCVVGSPFVCDSNQFVVGEDGFRVVVRSGLDENLVIEGLSYRVEGEFRECQGFNVMEVRGSGDVLLECVFQEEDVLLVGSSANVELNVNYRNARDSTGEFGRTIGGDIRADVEELRIGCPTSMEGSGVELDPFRVCSLEDLDAVRNDLDAFYVLVRDIDANPTSIEESDFWNSGEGWEPIGSLTEAFTGFFDGNGFVIRNLFVNNSVDPTGLFGQLENATIRNVGLENVDVIGVDRRTGGLFGQGTMGTEIHDVYVTGNVYSNRKWVGLIGGALWSDGVLNNSYAIGIVTGGDGDAQATVGGLLGETFGLVVNSYFEGEVYGSPVRDVGGLVGFVGTSGVINSSYSKGFVFSPGNNVGGLVGQNRGTILNSYSHANVSSQAARAGGLVGYERNIVRGSYSTGLVTSTSTTSINGFTGSGGVDSDNYWDVQTSNQSSSPALAQGLETSQMSGENTLVYMSEFDFDNIWGTSSGYPELRWQD